MADAKYDRKADVFVKPDSIRDNLRKRRMAMEGEGETTIAPSPTAPKPDDNTNTKTEETLRRREDSGAYAGVDDDAKKDEPKKDIKLRY